MGERIRFYRLLRRDTMQQLADRAGVSLRTIWRAETGRSRPHYRNQERIAAALGVDVWDISVNPLPSKPEQVSHLVGDRRQTTVYEALADQEPDEDPSPSRSERRRKERRKKPKGKRKK